LDSAEVLNKLRKEHASASVLSKTANSSNEGCKWMGVDVYNEGICNTLDSGVWEPAAKKLNAIAAATEAACCILSIDETVRNLQSEKPGGGSQRVGLGAGGDLSISS
jgi:T-complex protein 1 subunit eta